MINTNIQWTDATVNFWTGCKKVSDGCKFCYMYRDKRRFTKDDPREVKPVSAGHIKKILRSLKTPALIFTCSWSDFFIEEADQWREEAWEVIRNHPQHDWQILTKRPERIRECLPHDWGKGWSNVWLGVTIESDKYKNRLLQLHELKQPDSDFLTFVSYEPAIGSLDLITDKEIRLSFEKLDWMIVGGESGNNVGSYIYRPCEMEWITSMIDQCQKTGVPVFVKQTGTYLAKQLGYKDRHGGNILEWTPELQVREFPRYANLNASAA